jgi:hypothetical protein
VRRDGIDRPVPASARSPVRGRAPAGLLITAAAAIVLAAGFDLSSIASIGSATALLVFTLVTAAHFRVREETGASTLVLSAKTLGVSRAFIYRHLSADRS